MCIYIYTNPRAIDQVNPQNAKLHYNLGHVLCGEGRGGGGDKRPKALKKCAALYREVSF